MTAPTAQRSFSETEYHTVGPEKEVEYFFASDARYCCILYRLSLPRIGLMDIIIMSCLEVLYFPFLSIAESSAKFRHPLHLPTYGYLSSVC